VAMKGPGGDRAGGIADDRTGGPCSRAGWSPERVITSFCRRYSVTAAGSVWWPVVSPAQNGWQHWPMKLPLCPQAARRFGVVCEAVGRAISPWRNAELTQWPLKASGP